MALVIRVAVIAVAALLFTAGQLRVLTGSAPRRTRYVIAWLVVTIVLAALISHLDSLVGRAAASDRMTSAVFAGVTAALALGAGARLSQSPFWQAAASPGRVVALLVLHALIVFLADSVAR